MKCPYCEKEMTLGRIEAHELLQWIPSDDYARGSTVWAKAPRGIVLAKYFMLAPAEVEAFLCSECQKIVIDIA